MTTALKKLAALAWLCGTLSILALGACVCRVASAQNGGVGNEAMKRMPPDADPSFEVATIKPSDPNSRDAGFQLHGRNVVIKNQTVGHMLTFAYGIHPKQLIGEPTWFTTDRYDIVGVPDVEGEPNLKQWQGIVRKVLADRFGLYSAGVQLVCSDAQVGCSTGSWGSREKGSRGCGLNLSSIAWASRWRMGPRF